MDSYNYDPTVDGLLIDDEPVSETTVGVVKPAINVPPQLLSTAEGLAKQSMERKIQTGHIVNHHGAMQMYLANMSLAKHLGFTEEEKSPIVPFPSPTSNKTLTINDSGSEKVMMLASGMLEVIKTLAAPKPETSEQPEAEKPDTTKPETPVTAVDDSVDLRIVTKDETKPVVVTTPPVVVKDPVTTPPATQPTPDNTWTGLCKKYGWIAAMVVALLSGGGATSLYYYLSNTTAPTTPVRADSDVEGRIGVSIE